MALIIHPDRKELSFRFQMLLAFFFLAFFFHEQSISFCTLQKYTLKPQRFLCLCILLAQRLAAVLSEMDDLPQLKIEL